MRIFHRSIKNEQINEGCAPQLYTVEQLGKWDVTSCYDGKRWVPARPMGYMGWYGLKYRIKFAWGVFTGRYDAVKWTH